MIACVEVRLTIPDNEARTAFATLQRLGVPVSDLERADLYRCDIDGHGVDAVATLRGCESLYNPNKHVLAARAGDRPGPGEVWVDEVAHGGRVDGPVVVGGRTLSGFRSIERYVAWRLADLAGAPASTAVVAEAARALLCNPAFQSARFEESNAR